MSVWDIFILIIIIITTIISITIISGWSVALKKLIIVHNPSAYSFSSLGMRCSPDGSIPIVSGNPTTFIPQLCSSNLTCQKLNIDDEWGKCYVQIGNTCNSYSECTPEAVSCNGYCVTQDMASLGQACTIESLEPTTDTCGGDQLKCLLPNGTPLIAGATGTCGIISGSNLICKTNSQCYSNYCDPSGVCQDLITNGNGCSISEQCVSNFCDTDSSTILNQSGGICQPLNIITGTFGAACERDISSSTSGGGTGVGCNSGLWCSYAYTDVTPREFGICAPSLLIWPAVSCDVGVSSCIPPTICFNRHCVLPQNSSSYYPNSCDSTLTTGLCDDGYQCVGGTCTPNSSGVPSASGTYYGIAKWINTATSGTSIGHWQQITSGDSLDIPISNQSLTSIDFQISTPILGIPNIGSLYLFSSDITPSTDDVVPFFILGVPRILNSLLIDSTGVYKPENRLIFTFTSVAPQIIFNELKIYSVKFDQNSNIVFDTYINITSGGSTHSTHFPVVHPIPLDWFTTTPTTFSFTWNIAFFYSGGDNFGNWVEMPETAIIQYDGRQVFDENQVLSSYMSVYSDFVISIVKITGALPPDFSSNVVSTIVNPEISSNSIFPYIKSKNSDNSNNYIYNDIYSLQTSNRIKVFGDGLILASFPNLPNLTSIYLSCSYNIGATPDQISFLYLTRNDFNASYNLIETYNLKSRILPGYFESVDVPCVSNRYIGPHNQYIIPEYQYSPIFSIFARLKV
jgi:hypothetical protein